MLVEGSLHQVKMCKQCVDSLRDLGERMDVWWINPGRQDKEVRSRIRAKRKTRRKHAVHLFLLLHTIASVTVHFQRELREIEEKRARKMAQRWQRGIDEYGRGYYFNVVSGEHVMDPAVPDVLLEVERYNEAAERRAMRAVSI